MAQMLLVEVDANNRVLVRVYDVTAEKFIYEYLIDNVTEADKTKFSHETRRSAASAPEFAESAEITIKNIFGQYVFSVPQAKAADNDIVFDYRLSITNTAGEEIASTAALSKYYLAEVPERISFDKLKLGKGSYTAVVTAVDAWGFESEPITLDFNI